MRTKKTKAKLTLLTDHFSEPVQVIKLQEYYTLMIGDRMITQGESEVLARIDQLVRENGLEFYLE